MAKFKVNVIRTGYAHQVIEVEAEDEAGAKRAALDQAGSLVFSEYDADYEADYVSKDGVWKAP